MFALDYRAAPATVHGRHADLCFSRTGIARMGTAEPRYDRAARAFDPLNPADPYAFRAVPQRFAAYIAMRAPGDRDSFGPQDFVGGDDKRDFWVPLHKLFSGPECIAGQHLDVIFASRFVNEKLRRFHRYLETQGYPSDWTGDDLERFPFVIRDELIASLSRRAEYGQGVLEPRPAPLAVRARYQDRWLTFEVPRDFVAEPGVMYFSTAQILPGPAETEPTYLEGLAPTTNRPAPEYISIRHRLREDGSLENLNHHPEMMKTLSAGGYQAQHFIDFAGDGWIEARCPQITAEVRTRAPAYALVAPPDFFPLVSQRDLTLWWRNEVPKAVRAALWAVPPIHLSERRMAANIHLPAGFSINDTTVTALVAHPGPVAGATPAPKLPLKPRYSGLPDQSPGVFDPGWDASQGIHYSDPDVEVQPYLQSFGLGTPFVEDVKLCAALGSYWPAVAPDSARTFAPVKRGPGFDYPWPTVVPLTDEEIGIVPTAVGLYKPWDGVRGPRLETIEGRQVAVYPDINRVDMLANLDRMTAELLARIDLEETKTRVMAMACVYWGLGIHDPALAEQHKGKAVVETLKAKAGWAVLSFRPVAADDGALREAEAAAGSRLAGARRYGLHLFRPGTERPHPSDLQSVVVELGEQAFAFSDATSALVRQGGESWRHDTSMPKS
ncbi:MAG TPA: hypothetical protein VEA41_19760 [Salinarimonas sp.]|nr:hypothetical protein [Salinarimonas sp.]